MKTRTRIMLATLAMLSVWVVVAFVAWCGGYNFDSRNENVALVAGLSALMGIFAFGETLILTME